MGHRVPNHASKCKNPHGHRYTIEVAVQGDLITIPRASDEGMVIDFGDLKDIMMKEIHDVFDHSFTISRTDDLVDTWLHWKDGLGMKINAVDFIPTAEKLAEHWYGLIKEPLKTRGIKLITVEVHETPTSVAIYGEEN